MRQMPAVQTEVGHLGNTFSTRFEVVPALSRELQNEAFRIRHKVYCEDLGFESLRADGLETDQHDGHSLHLLVRHVDTDEYIACARVVQTDPEDRSAPLPFEVSCSHTLNRALVDPSRLPREKIGEVSRLAIIGKYRRRKGESTKPYSLSEEDFGTQTQPRFPYLLVGMYLGVVAVAMAHGIETLFILTEPRLAQHFSRLGIDLQQIGDPVQYRGTRIPSMFNPNEIVAGLNRFLKPLHSEIAQRIQRATTLH